MEKYFIFYMFQRFFFLNVKSAVFFFSMLVPIGDMVPIEEHAKGKYENNAIYQHLISCPFYKEQLDLFALFNEELELYLHI